MEARVGTLAVGTRIVTLLTGRQGTVRAGRGEDGSVIVTFDEVLMAARLHPDVRVRVVETFH